MRGRHFFGFMTMLVLIAPLAHGDAILEVMVGGDSVALPSKVAGREGCQPCVSPPRPGDIITYHVASDRIRRDRGPLSVILNKEKRKVYFLCRDTKQYSQFANPVQYHKVLRDDYRKSLGDLITFQLAAPATPHP